MNLPRCHRLASRIIQALGLDLRGMVVLTEAATGHFALTAPLAALAGAKEILAIGRDSRFGSRDQAEKACQEVAAAWGVADRLTFLHRRDDHRIKQAHVVTNLGALRPLDKAFLSRLGPFAAVPLMWETWEYRPEDLDLGACRGLGIPVLGTDEGRTELQTLRFVGLSAVKLLFDAGVEVYRSRVAVLGEGAFARHVALALQALEAEVLPLSDGFAPLPPDLDAIIVAEHLSREVVLGGQGMESLAAGSPGAVIVHISGAVDWEAATRLGIAKHPSVTAPAGYMSVTADYPGPRALIELHAAGLKVGRELAAARERGLHGLNAELAVLGHCALAQGFADRHPAPKTIRPPNEADS